jgi:ATP-binding cassette subfamily B protein
MEACDVRFESGRSAVTAGKSAAAGAAITVGRLWRHLSRRRRVQFYLLLGLIVAGALAEVVSLGAVLPFLAVLTDPERVFAMPRVGAWLRGWGFQSADQLILPIAALFALAAIATGAVRVVLLWASTRLAFATGADLSFELYRRTLCQPYEVHIHRNSSEIISGITNKVGAVIDVMNQILLAAGALLILVAVTVALMFIELKVALSATIGFGLSYAAVAYFSRHRLHKLGLQIADDETRLIKALQEGLGGIRDVLLDGTQPLYCEIYRRADVRLRAAQGNTQFIANCPRFVMESFGMLLIAGLAYALSHEPGGVRAAIPALGALALGAQRVLPVLQQLYSSWTSVVGRQASVESALNLLEQPLPAHADLGDVQLLTLKRAIEFMSVRFRYAPSGPWVMNGLDLSIPRGARVGLVGTTGSGKSTLIDLLMGLLSPEMGAVLIDGEPLTGTRVRAWQRNIAHVPQSIYLADVTAAENIALGVPREKIDMQKVRGAAARARIAEFIESLPEGYEERVGERGVRLSGGQRQRIGIARALYKDANVLVFDEATSALDHATEQAIMESIASLDRQLTVVQIAHRLTTLRNCDFIVEVAAGQVAAQGAYDELMDNNAGFRQMASSRRGESELKAS